MRDKRNQRIAILFPGALGDFVCLLPAIHELAERAQVEIFAKSEFSDIVPRNVSVGALERYEINRLFVTGGAAERRLREFFSPYEMIYSWVASSQPAFRNELGTAAPGRVRFFAFRGTDPAMHQADYYLSCLGFSQGPLHPVTIPLRRDAVKWNTAFWQRYALDKKPVLVIAPGSGAKEKNWPAVYFAAVGHWWRERCGGEVVVLLGPVERERGGVDGLAEHFIMAPDLNLAQAAALLSRGDLFLGNDSGITHLAAAVGVRTVALFGPSDPRRWAPRGPKVSLLSAGLACSSCDTDAMKACPHHRCLHHLAPVKVIAKLEKINEVATLTRWGARITVQAS